MNVNQKRGEWSWGKSLFVKISLLGMGVALVWWTGWPHPQIRHDNRVSLSPMQYQAARIPSSPSLPTLETGAVIFDSLPFSRGQEEKKNPPVIASALLVDLNLGSRRELETLPGIGVILAGRIVDHRSQHGYFKHVQDLSKVDGIGDKRFKRLEPFVTVQSNTAARAS